MYPDLSYFIHDVFGTPYDNWTSIFKTFGLFLALAFFISAFLLYIELKRKAKEGLFAPSIRKIKIGAGANTIDLAINIICGFIFSYKVGYVIHHIEEFQQNPTGITFSLKGNLVIGIMGSILIGSIYFWFANRYKKEQPEWVNRKIYPHHRVGEITTIAAISGILGSKLFSIFENFSSFLENPIQTFLSGSGLTIYGGLILGFICVYAYIRLLKINPIHVMDAVAPSLMMGYIVGRMGCHFSGDGDWGIPAAQQPEWWFFPDWLWAYHYPHNVADFYQQGPILENCEALFCTYLDPMVYPTPLYEIAMCSVIFGVLWYLRKKITLAGGLFFVYVTLNGVERFIIEGIRVNERYDILGINWSLSKYIALVLILIGGTGLFVLYKRANKIMSS